MANLEQLKITLALKLEKLETETKNIGNDLIALRRRVLNNSTNTQCMSSIAAPYSCVFISEEFLIADGIRRLEKQQQQNNTAITTLNKIDYSDTKLMKTQIKTLEKRHNIIPYFTKLIDAIIGLLNKIADKIDELRHKEPRETPRFFKSSAGLLSDILSETKKQHAQPVM